MRKLRPSMDQTITFKVSDFVAVLNQTLEFAYPSVIIEGELANFRVSKNRWIYFDLKDELATLRFFGTVYQLPGPLEDGMVLKVRGTPRLHQQYGFSVNVQTIQPTGEGTIRRAAELLMSKLQAEGLFDESRKRMLPYPPERIGLITSGESAAFADFMKILNARWRGINIQLIDVQVQGEAAPAQIAGALEQLNEEARPPEVIVLIRGGGSAEDLAAFSTEQVTRAVAASRVPTLVAIGHEVDISLAELAADQRASTPSNAAELLVPDRKAQLAELKSEQRQLSQLLNAHLIAAHSRLAHTIQLSHHTLNNMLRAQKQALETQCQLLSALSPRSILERGYVIVCKGRQIVRSTRDLRQNDIVILEFIDGRAAAAVTEIKE